MQTMEPERRSDEIPFDTLDLRGVVNNLWRSRWLICAVAFIAAVLAGVVAFQMTPVYRATVVMVPANTGGAGLGGSRGAMGSIAALAGIDFSSTDAATKEALAVLKSRRFADEFIRVKNLIPAFFPKLWNSSTKQWKVPLDEQPTDAVAFKYFDRHVRTVVENSTSNMVALQINWRDRQSAAEWANELVVMLNAEMRRRAIEKSEASLVYLRRELGDTVLLDTRSAINRLIETQLNERMLANVSTEYAFRVVDPAAIPDRDDVVRPRKLIMVIIGGFLGMLAGIAIVAMFRR
jgi:uncharacterized protein involved in exopolysaccharide biosynthesis